MYLLKKILHSKRKNFKKKYDDLKRMRFFFFLQEFQPVTSTSDDTFYYQIMILINF